MKIKSIFAIAAMASLFASCAQEEFEFYGHQTGKVVATMENPNETRTNVTDQGYFTWVTDDQISIHTNDGFILGTLNEGNGTPQGTFAYSYEGTTAPTLTGYALYPYNSKHAISESSLSFVMPSVYNLGIKTSNTNVAMLACPGEAKTQGQGFSFSHLAGAFRISFKNTPAGASKLEFSLGGKKINGTFSVNLENPAINTEDTENAAEQTTTLNFTPLKTAQDLELYVPAPVGEYIGINAKLYKEDGTLLGEWGKATTVVTVNKQSLKLMTEINFGGVSGDIENNQQVATEAQLRAAVVNGGTITLTEDITLESSIVVGAVATKSSTESAASVTVNLNGKTIKCESSDVFVVTDGTLTIDGEGLVYGSESNKGNSCAVWVNGANAKAIIKNGTYKVGGDIQGDLRNDCIYVGSEGGEIEIYGGDFEYTGEDRDGNSDGRKFLVNQHNKHTTQLITIYGGTFHDFNPANANTDDGWMTNNVGSYVAAGYSSVAGENGTYEVKKGILNETALKAAVASGLPEVILGANIDLTSSLEVSRDLVVNLNSKSIKCASSDVFVVTAGTLTINDNGKGLVYGSESNEGNSCAVWVNGANAKAIIKNGTYKVGGDIYGESDQRNDCIYVGEDGGTIEIYGGFFEYTGEFKDGSLNDGSRFLVNQNDKHATQLITVYGGTFHNFDPANAKTGEPWMTNGVGSFVATGYSSVAGENGTYEVKKGVLNETALKAAVASGLPEVILGANIDLTSSLEVSRDLVVNLNSKSIKCTSSDVFVVTAGTLTINDNGNGLVYGSEDNSSSSCAVWAKVNGNVIINGGTYKVGHDGASKAANKANWRNDCIYARDNAKITINGGEFAYTGDINTSNFESDGNRFLLNCRNADYQAGTSLITVKGGKFHKFNPAATSSENPVASYVAAGYESTTSDDGLTYVVVSQN